MDDGRIPLAAGHVLVEQVTELVLQESDDLLLALVVHQPLTEVGIVVHSQVTVLDGNACR